MTRGTLGPRRRCSSDRSRSWWWCRWWRGPLLLLLLLLLLSAARPPPAAALDAATSAADCSSYAILAQIQSSRRPHSNNGRLEILYSLSNGVGHRAATTEMSLLPTLWMNCEHFRWKMLPCQLFLSLLPLFLLFILTWFDPVSIYSSLSAD